MLYQGDYILLLVMILFTSGITDYLSEEMQTTGILQPFSYSYILYLYNQAGIKYKNNEMELDFYPSLLLSLLLYSAKVALKHCYLALMI